MAKRMTIADIARNLELDYSTVLRILNNDFKNHKYNPETVKKVVEYAGKHNLIKNHVASALKNGKTFLIGISVPDLGASHFFAKLSSLISRGLLDHGYKAIISDTMDNPEQELQNIKDFISYRVDGIILSPFAQLPELSNLVKDIPVVTVDNNFYPEYDFIGLDETNAAEMLLEKMINTGSRKIGLAACYHAEERIKNFRKAAAGITLLTPSAEFMRNDAVDLQCEQFLKSGCDTIIGVNSNSLIQAVKYVNGKGLKVPHDIKLAGVDEVPLLNTFMPQVPMISQPIEKYASKAVEILIGKIDKKKLVEGEKFLFKGKLIGGTLK